MIYMGTPDFAVPSLKALIDAGENVTAVFTQPDKPQGRKMKLTPPPVKVCAEENGIPVYQPVSLKKGEDAKKAFDTIRDMAPELIVVAAYGKILPPEILSLPKYGCINVHASLLPAYRGAGPIQWSIINGESRTGVTTMQMAEGLDTGDMLVSKAVDIMPDETADELHDRLAVLGADVLLDTIAQLKEGKLSPVKQDDALSSYAPMLSKELSPIDFSKPAKEVHDLIRGLSSWPCAIADIEGRTLKVYRSHLEDTHYDLPAGTVCDRERFTVVCGDGGAVTFLEVQASGGKRMSTADYLRGNRL